MPSFEALPFNTRPDLTPYIIHLTKRSATKTAYQNLVSILRSGTITGTTSYIVGGDRAACLMDVPFASMKYVLTPQNTDPQKPCYEPFGVAIQKKYAYENGCRPVLHLSKKEQSALNIPQEELWRVVRFEVSERGWISWLHDREWRCKGDLELPSNALGSRLN